MLFSVSMDKKGKRCFGKGREDMDFSTVPYRQREHLEYPELTMFQMVERMAVQYPDEPAYDFYGKKTSYSSFISKIERAARALIAIGIRRDDAVTI